MGSNMVDVEEAIVTQTLGTSHPNDQLTQPNFLPFRHG